MVTTVKKIEIDTEILNKISEIAKDENTTENKIINDILKKEFKNSETKDVPDFFEMGGIFTTEEPFDAVEDIKKMRNGEL